MSTVSEQMHALVLEWKKDPSDENITKIDKALGWLYKAMVKKHLGGLRACMAEDDIVQECRIYALDALSSYDETKGNVNSYLTIVCHRRLITLWKMSQNSYNKVLNESRSYESLTANEDGERHITHEPMTEEPESDPWEECRARLRELIDAGEVSALEYAVIQAWSSLPTGNYGDIYKRVAVMVQTQTRKKCTWKTVDNVLCRLRNKINAIDPPQDGNRNLNIKLIGRRARVQKYNREYYIKNKQRNQERCAAWYAANKANVCAAKRERYHDSRKYKLEYQREYYLRHKEDENFKQKRRRFSTDHWNRHKDEINARRNARRRAEKELKRQSEN